MIWVLLQSESPWQHNDAITFFIYLCVSLFQEQKDRICIKKDPRLNLRVMLITG